jgi:hypothetical protein
MDNKLSSAPPVTPSLNSDTRCPHCQQAIKTSSFRLLWCTMTFTDEPMWVRLVIIGIMVGATVAIVYFLKELVLVHAVGKRLAGFKIGVFLKKLNFVANA